MRGFLAGVGVATVLFALTSFAYWSGRSEAAAAAPAAARTSVVVLGDLPLYRGFQAVVPFALLPNGGVEMSTVFPATLGAAITQVSIRNSAYVFADVDFVVDGLIVAQRHVSLSPQSTAPSPVADFVFDPPLVVPPGHTFGVRLTGSVPFTYPTTASIGGWVLFPGDV